MAKKNKATVAKRLKLEAYRQGINLSELKRRQKLEEIGGKLLPCVPSQTPEQHAHDTTRRVIALCQQQPQIEVQL
jgi:hypothetical protein